ncbi:CutC family protein [Thecamonas trahens ATCC 50062]|uniref:Copper homeostasis protein cutC homolog n=1 Tax=Thecamonas trahens ATCC 50062 TaxID=461836 RepID=A0A0L0DTT1_THETB|nr:CutC family protein [Thecamonas trahens ATCC 50062]KNC55744.1 CutC family protein [Thecamonas trahens ATCC 50062]|eukprot:XP_013752897.1 CutC family protein [Thecamonas trahens ATCC 50062]
MSSGAVLEACVDCPASARAAIAGRVNSIELCAGLATGGVTPSLGLIRAVACMAAAATPPVPITVLVRLRDGDFVYSPDDIAVMVDDIAAIGSLAADLPPGAIAGVAIGALAPDGTADLVATAAMARAAQEAGLAITLHRAFDAAIDPVAAYLAVVDHLAGAVSRVLTSGGAATAAAGTDALHQLLAGLASTTHGQAVTVVAAAGLSPTSASGVLAAGAHGVHGSFSTIVVRADDEAAVAGEAIGFGRGHRETDAEVVAAVADVMALS